MSETIRGYHFSVPAKSSAENYIRVAQRLTEIGEFAGRLSEIKGGDNGQVIRHLFGLAEIELRRAEESIERLRQKVRQLEVERVLDQCS